MFRLLACLSVVALLCGFRPTPVPPPSAQRPVLLSVIDREQGDALVQYPHRGQRWIEGSPGHRYAVRLQNTTDQRVLVVLSVDGVNAIPGATASPEQAGYVLAPRESTEITGWRKSSTEVAQFVFTDNGDSYASRTGRPANVGVIGIAAFREAGHRIYQAPPIETLRRSAPSPAPVAAEASSNRAADLASVDVSGSRERQQLGTGHGQREWSASSSTSFERASRQPTQVSELRYDARARLHALRIIPAREPRSSPRAFPDGFVPDPPPRWR